MQNCLISVWKTPLVWIDYNQNINTANIRGVTLKGISRWPSDHTKNCCMIQYKDDIYYRQEKK